MDARRQRTQAMEVYAGLVRTSGRPMTIPGPSTPKPWPGTRLVASAAPAPAGPAAADSPRPLLAADLGEPAILDARAESTPGPLLDVRARDQLARNLLAELIDPLFALGLQLQATTGLVEDDEASRRLDAAIEDLDAMIRDLRARLFAPAAVQDAAAPT